VKKVIQKRIVEVKVLQKEIAEYYCDQCGQRTGIRGNPKSTWTGPDGQTHYCQRTCRPHGTVVVS
jgi:hypothetical protein